MDKTRITKAKIKDFIQKYTEVVEVPKNRRFKPDEPWYRLVSKDTKCYLDGCSDPEKLIENQIKNKSLNFYIEHGITHFESTFIEPNNNSVANLGFSEKENKWYGWSHRAIFGFTEGSTCKKGDVHFNPANEDDFIEDTLKFWSDEYVERQWVDTRTKDYFVAGLEFNDKMPAKNRKNTIDYSLFKFPKSYGRGEWVANNMEDAKQMAIDFANNIA